MDAICKKLVLVLAALSFLQGCAQSKTSSSVFPNNDASKAGCGKSASEKRFIVQWEDGAYTVEKGESSDHFRKTFVEKNLALIKHIDRDVMLQVDVKSDLHAEANGGLNWGPDLIQAQTLWSQGVEGSGMVVGVIDGMVDVTHQQLKGNILSSFQVNDEKNDPARNRHGSHVAGIIAADPTQGPVQGVAPKAKIVSAQFITNSGAGSIGDAIVGLNYAVSKGARILNLSWGAGSCTEIPTLQSALQEISDKGVLVVTAAGNGDDYGVGINMDVYPSYPSAYNLLNQINVAATTFNDYMVGFSNYGLKTVHVAAPGVNIYSTVPGNEVDLMSGTSMAAPMTSGAAALIWSAFPQASATQVKKAILRGVDIVPGKNLEVLSRGRINVVKAYNELKSVLGQ